LAWNQIAAAFIERIVPLLTMWLPAPCGFTASPLFSEPAASTVAPCSTVSVLSLRKSMVLAPDLYRPVARTALFCTNAPDLITMLARSNKAIAEASPTTICALAFTVTLAPVAALGPVPTVLVHGAGAAVSHTVDVPVVVHAACACVNQPKLDNTATHSTRRDGQERAGMRDGAFW